MKMPTDHRPLPLHWDRVFAPTAKPSRGLYALGGFSHPRATFNGALGPRPDRSLGRSDLPDRPSSVPSTPKSGSKTQTLTIGPPHLAPSEPPTSCPPKPD